MKFFYSVLVLLGLASIVLFASFLTNFSSSPLVFSDDGVFLSFVSGTEYSFGDAGQVIVEVRDRNSVPVASVCYVSIWYPDKSLFMDSVLANSSVTGNYYVAFIVPQVRGVYEYQANCTVNAQSRIVSKSFHVSQPRISAAVVK